jgi:glycosyltransferase involved in cell wall biosynthesis
MKNTEFQTGVLEKKSTMSQAPLFSAVIPVYNYGRFVGQAIESVLNQSMQDFELIIVNDASTDNSDEVIQKYLEDKRIRYFTNNKNSGCYFSLQRGFSESKGTYAASLSADDFYMPDALEKLAREARTNPDADIIYGKYCFVNEEGQLKQWVKHPGWDSGVRAQRKSDLADLLQYDLYINITAAFVKLNLFRDYQFDQQLRVSDYDYILQLAQDNRKFHFVDEYLLSFRHHGEQLSVGDNFYVDGTQLKDQLTLLERYVIPENYSKLAGAEKGILRLLDSKVKALMNYPESASKILPELSMRINNITNTIASLNSISVNTKKNTGPEVSVIIPTFNRPAMLAEALKSIAAQTFTSFEVIVINDGGLEVTDVIKASPIASKVNYISLGINHERSFVRNCGLKIARGKYIAYLDDDDIYYPDHLQTLTDALKNSSFRAAYTDAYRAVQVLENGCYKTIRRELLYSQDFSIGSLLVSNMFPNLCVMHERSLIDSIGYLDETLDTHEDWDYWIKIGLTCHFTHVKKITAEYTYRNDLSNTTSYNYSDFNRTREIIYKRYEQYASSNPQITAMQKSIMDSVKFENPKDDKTFVEALISFSTENKISELIRYYDLYRKKFSDNIDLLKVDEMIAKLKVRFVAEGV